MKAKAFLFDLNGTMINDMPYHIKAWHKILNDLGAALSYERVKEECYGKNSELLERIFPGRFSDTQKSEMELEKEKAYQTAYGPDLKLIEGLDFFLKESHEAGIKMAIASAAILFNIDFVIDGLHIRHYFDAIVSAESVEISKPHPETYLMAADLLQAVPEDCIVFEDTPKGVESALNAGMRSIVITSLHQKDEFTSYPNVIRFVKDFAELRSENVLQQVLS
jgi:beta-phosphoglucomutase